MFINRTLLYNCIRLFEKKKNLFIQRHIFIFSMAGLSWYNCLFSSYVWDLRTFKPASSLGDWLHSSPQLTPSDLSLQSWNNGSGTICKPEKKSSVSYDKQQQPNLDDPAWTTTTRKIKNKKIILYFFYSHGTYSQNT